MWIAGSIITGIVAAFLLTYVVILASIFVLKARERERQLSQSGQHINLRKDEIGQKLGREDSLKSIPSIEYFDPNRQN